MKVVILAAGKGSRLAGGELPKPLTLLTNEKSILEMQLEVLERFVLPHDIILVVGYRKEEVMKRFTGLSFVNSPGYASENTSKSLALALQKIDEDILWLNGDVVMHPSVIESVIGVSKTGMVVNKGPVGDEEVKYRTDRKGGIIEVSKQVFQPEGEALGINYWEKKDLDSLKKNLTLCLDHDYFERGIELCIKQGIKVQAILVDRELCKEIDFPEDLERANQMIRKWSS